MKLQRAAVCGGSRGTGVIRLWIPLNAFSPWIMVMVAIILGSISAQQIAGREAAAQ